MDKEIYTNMRNFQGKLQLRPFKEEIYKFVLKQVKHRSDCFITKEVQQKSGLDIYLTSNHFLMALGKRLKKSFKGTIKLSRTLHTRDKQTSKPLYRVTVCFRLED